MTIQSPHPRGAPLPLLLDGDGHYAQRLLLVHAQAAPAVAASAGAGGQAAAARDGSDAAGDDSSDARTRVVVAMRQQLAEVAVDVVAVRAHAAGWEPAAQCLNTYAVMAEQARSQLAASTEARAGAHGAARPAAAPGAASKQAASELRRHQSPQPPRQRLPAPPASTPREGAQSALRLRLRQLLVEVVADAELDAPDSGDDSSAGSGGGDALLPACALHAELQVDLWRDAADASSRLKLALPGVLVVVGAVPASTVASCGASGAAAPAALPLLLSDSLLGLRLLEANTLTREQQRQVQPAATTAEGSVQLSAAHQTSIGVSLAQASLWAHPRNLCAVAALAGRAQALAAALQGHLATASEGDLADKVGQSQPCSSS